MTPPARTLDDTLKRAVDLVVSTATLTVLGVPLGLAGLAIALDSPGPIFYRGLRIGRHGKPFKLFKFRSMAAGGAPGPTTTTEDDPRITRVGRILRKYKLDELPQF